MSIPIIRTTGMRTLLATAANCFKSTAGVEKRARFKYSTTCEDVGQEQFSLCLALPITATDYVVAACQ